MDNSELSEIDASAQAIIRRAYDLGRKEALKRVVEVLSTDRSSADQLALMAPEPPPAADHEGATNGAASGSNGVVSLEENAMVGLASSVTGDFVGNCPEE